MMIRPAKSLYLFDEFRVDPGERMLSKGDREVPLTPKVFDTLLVLLENSNHMLTKKELMQQVWPDSFVEENNLAQNISLLRKALGKSKQGEQYIQTVPKRGYRFVGNVAVTGGHQDSLIVHERTRARIIVESGDDQIDRSVIQSLVPGARVIDVTPVQTAVSGVATEGHPYKEPETRYARSGEVNIAYQVIGDAPLDLVFVMGWVSHLEYFWREPSFARFLQRLASFSRLILFDKRGTGLSDRVPIHQLPTLEQRMDDVRAVMDAAGSERAALCGVEFLTGVRHRAEPDTVLATVLVGRIVGVREHVVRLGQDRWSELLRRLHAHITREIEWFRGRELDLMGNRLLAIFDGPARAVRCATAITEYASRLSVQTCIGLHTGECEIVDGQVSGVAAQMGVCVANEAEAGEVLVSSTVKDLVAGSGINFADRGIRDLAGCGESRLFEVRRGSP